VVAIWYDGVLCRSACAVMAAAHVLVSWSSSSSSSSSSSAGGSPKAALAAAAVVHQMQAQAAAAGAAAFVPEMQVQAADGAAVSEHQLKQHQGQQPTRCGCGFVLVCKQWGWGGEGGCCSVL
jgi:hypothetical protein